MRLIDADSLESSGRFESMKNGDWEYVEVVYKDDIDSAPTIDAIEVVRCKNCKYLRIDSDFMKGRYCAIRNVNGGGFCKDEDYCSYGVRRKDGEV